MTAPDGGSLRQAAAHGVKWTSVGMITATALGVVQLTILTRLLSTADFGMMTMATTVVGFAQVFADMGFSGAIIYRQDATRAQLSSLYWTSILVSFALGGVSIAVAPLIASFYQEPHLVQPLRLVSLVFFITPLGQQFQMLLQKELEFTILAWQDIVGAVAGLVVAVSTATAGQGVYALVWGQIAQVTVRATVVTVIGWRRWTPQFRLHPGDLRGFVTFGLYQMGQRTLTYWGANIDYLLIGRFLGASQLGVYTIAYNLVVVPLTKLTPMLTRVSFPVFARRQNDDAALRRGYCELIELVAFTTFPLLVGLAATSSVAVVALFGTAWLPSVLLVQLMAAMGMMHSISSPSGSLFLAKGRADIGFWENVVYTTLVLGVLYLAVHFGTAAVAASHSLLSIAFMPFEVYLIWLVCRLRPRAYLRSLVRPIVTSGIMGACVYATCVLLRSMLPPAACLAILVVEGALVYFATWRVVARDYVPNLYRLLRARP